MIGCAEAQTANQYDEGNRFPLCVADRHRRAHCSQTAPICAQNSCQQLRRCARSDAQRAGNRALVLANKNECSQCLPAMLDSIATWNGHRYSPSAQRVRTADAVLASSQSGAGFPISPGHERGFKMANAYRAPVEKSEEGARFGRGLDCIRGGLRGRHVAPETAIRPASVGPLRQPSRPKARVCAKPLGDLRGKSQQLGLTCPRLQAELSPFDRVRSVFPVWACVVSGSAWSAGDRLAGRSALILTSTWRR